jgi:hypothetical protein
VKMFELVNVPLLLTCGVCRRDYEIVLRLPDDVRVNTPTFTCRNCTSTASFGKPMGMDRLEWIARCAAAGWKCTLCKRAVGFDTVTHVDDKPACDRCRGRAYRGLPIVRIDQDAA